MAEGMDPSGGNEANEVQRIAAERDAARAQADEAARMLLSFQKRDAARAALKGKVEDPDTVADLVTQFLDNVKLEDVAAHVTSEQFAPRLAAFKPAATPPPAEGDESPSDEQIPATETPGFGGGPSFGQATGSTPPSGGVEKIKVGSDAYKALVDQGREALEEAYKAGRILEPTRGF